MGAAVFGLALRRFGRLDAEAADIKGARLGELFHRLSSKHRERALSNLRLAFPEWDEARLAEVALEVFRHFGRVAGDFLRSPHRTDAEVVASFSEVEGWETLRTALREGGVLGVTAHFGNWERLAHWVRAQGERVSVVAREANDEGMNARVNAIREGLGLKVIARGDAARPILRALKEGELIGLLPDQNSSEAFLPFFGRPCGTVLGPGVLHLRSGAPLIPAYSVRLGPGRYRFEVLEPLEGGTPEALMTQANAALEGIVRRYPEQYLWFHDRWKSARRKGLL